MTTPAPRHVRDLLAFGTDSEDESDARQANTRKEEFDNGNKENQDQPKAARHQMAKDIRPAPAAKVLFPRRRAELTMMDSDSDDEDNKNDHNLNCAILNDSFVLSPMHELTSNTSMTSKAVALRASDSNLSFLGRFGNMGINCSTSTTTGKSPPLQVEQQQQPAELPIKKPPPSTLQIISEQRKAVSTKTPLRTSLAPSLKKQPKPESEFVTPQVCSLATRQSTRTQKTHNELANEFRSQKVLFQTPMTVSRAAPFTSDSLSFSLCDTISESPDTPAQPQPKVEAPIGNKSKKSLDCQFRHAEQEKPELALPVPAAVSVPVPAATLPDKPETTTKSNALQIKNHEYLMVKKLGCGGSSSVYLARRKDTGQEFALKVVDLQADPVVVQGYLNETKLLEKLQGNVCVVSLYDYQLLRQESKLYMVMEKGDCDLNKILQGFTTNLPLYNLMNILYQMLQAVNYIHQNGVIHSDLKPANFLMVNGRLKLIDFGIASNIAVDSTSIIKFSQAGTFNYISPEALTDISTGSSPMRGSNQPKIKISTKSDVWSLGCILYLLLYQKTPFGHIRNINAKMNAIANPGTSIEYPALPIYYPLMLVHMVKNCLQLNPKKRPSCVELLKYPFHMVIPLQNLQLESKR
ncbi:dual specificity protein kinase Ttk [Drosophila hydei]|uniref:Dual specificity protein kinase Ttk n=1 Tax=Drosophila hydei TaxID=7224 RepID=A0A6J1LVA5_DROHY|nr:dual specificity protein kinase Ttk [Drosophila hydei]